MQLLASEGLHGVSSSTLCEQNEYSGLKKVSTSVPFPELTTTFIKVIKDYYSYIWTHPVSGVNWCRPSSPRAVNAMEITQAFLPQTPLPNQQPHSAGQTASNLYLQRTPSSSLLPTSSYSTAAKTQFTPAIQQRREINHSVQKLSFVTPCRRVPEQFIS